MNTKNTENNVKCMDCIYLDDTFNFPNLTPTAKELIYANCRKEDRMTRFDYSCYRGKRFINDE